MSKDAYDAYGPDMIEAATEMVLREKDEEIARLHERLDAARWLLVSASTRRGNRAGSAHRAALRLALNPSVRPVHFHELR